ncbi:MAG: adenylate kinase [Gammaproteobacteria bacterium]|jgi:adenylate kinase|nr:adenylate kinase [Gammaproteobacteria bacterium]
MHHLRIILLGAPGAGKGTQAVFICEKLNLPKISTGDMLRAEISAGTPLGHKVKQLMANGQLVPDELIIDLLKSRVAQPDCAEGFLLDGFPRNVSQAEALIKANIAIDHVIYIHVPDEDIIKRLSGRCTHLASGRTYHPLFNPSKIADRDDVTGELLVQREDDTESAVCTRLKIYHQETKPVIQWYKNVLKVNQFHEIEGVGAVESIQGKILEVLKL